MFRPKEFLFSENQDEVLARLKSEGKHAHIIAGGTGFYELARRGYIPEVKDVVSIMKLGLDYVRSDERHFRIGATTRLQKLLESDVGASLGLEAIEDALKEIRPVQIRNVATVGGEICISVPIVDLPIALLTCRARLKIIGHTRKEYDISLEDFYIDAFLTKLKYGEFVSEVSVPKVDGQNTITRSAFSKIGRTAYDFNLVNVAVSLAMDHDKESKIKSIRIFFGGIKRIPFRAVELEKRLIGKNVEEETILRSAEVSFAKERLLPSVHGSEEYKMAILPPLLRDCIFKAHARFSEK